MIEPAIAKRKVDELVEALSAFGVPCSKVNSYKDVFESEQSKSRGIEIEGVHRRAGPVRMVRNAVLFDKDGPELDRMAPLLGEQHRGNPVAVRLRARRDPQADRRQGRRRRGRGVSMSALMRSLLFLPGNREKFLEKAASLDADGFIIDFEDSVPAAEKANARKCLAAFAPALQGKSIWVRPNASDSPYFEEDLAAICGTPGIAGRVAAEGGAGAARCARWTTRSARRSAPPGSRPARSK